MDLRLPALRGLLRGPRRLLAAGAAAVVLAGAGTWTAVASGEAPSVHRADRVMSVGDGVRIDTSYFTSGPAGRRPAVLLGHGFGGSKADVRPQAEQLARDGYAVLTWSARGFGRSSGKIGLNDPEGEVADVSRLVDWLAEQPQVELDAAGDPRVGMAGGSYGGAIALLTAGHDDRVDALAPAVTYWNLADALFPNGVFKKLWTGLFVTTGGGCDKFQPRLCRMYERVAESGIPDAEARALLEQRSPSASRCPRCWCRARPTPSSRSVRPTPPRRRSGRTAPRSTSTGSPAGTTAATWRRTACSHACVPGSTAT
jgi:ABC-2 type transport system ATP-binding protein